MGSNSLSQSFRQERGLDRHREKILIGILVNGYYAHDTQEALTKQKNTVAFAVILCKPFISTVDNPFECPAVRYRRQNTTAYFRTHQAIARSILFSRACL